MRKNLIQGKKGKARADAVREKLNRLKQGKFESEREKLMFDNLLKKKEGYYLSVNIGLKNAYKNLTKEEKAFYFNKDMSTMRGYELLKKKGIPLAKHKGTVKIRGKEMEMFEKARDLTKKEAYDKANEIINIIRKASKEGIFIDTKIENFGINKEGKIVIRDTNYIEKREPNEALKLSLAGLKQNFYNYGIADEKLFEKINKKKPKEKIYWRK